MGKSKSIIHRGLRFPIERDVRFKREDTFQIKKRNQQPQNYSLQIEQSLNLQPPSKPKQLKSATFVLNPKV